MSEVIDPVQFGKLMERVDNLVDAMEIANEQSSANAACTRQLARSIEHLTTRMGTLESSWLMQPKRIGRVAFFSLALVVLFALLGVKETLTLLAKAAL